MVLINYTNGDQYNGDYEDDQKHGHGTLTYSQGGSYTGEWENDIRNGYGVNKWPNGDQYKGNWKDNKRNGNGTYIYRDGGKYVGNWENDMRHGKGVNMWSNGNKYDGNWAKNQQHGRGTFTYASGGQYTGQWANNMRNGQGTNTWPNSDRYEGEWRRNRRHGQGILYHSNGTKESGVWNNGSLNPDSASDDDSDNNNNKLQLRGVWVNGQPFLFTLSQKEGPCVYQSLAREFVASLNWKDAFFDKNHDRCYCPNCYKKEWYNVIDAGDAKYVIPRGWVRVGLQTDIAFVKAHDVFDKWIVTFHGTSKIAAQSIIAHRQFCMPGDTLIDGTQLKIRPGHIPNMNFVYTSPTIAYSSGPAYSPVYDFYSKANNAKYEVQIVLQCRQMPNSFQIGPETIGAKGEICPHIPNSKIEYFTARRGTIVAYGLLVRFRPKT